MLGQSERRSRSKSRRLVITSAALVISDGRDEGVLIGG